MSLDPAHGLPATGDTDRADAAPVVSQHLVPDPDAMHALGVRLGNVLRAGDLAILTGPLGAGKTTLTRGLGEGLGVRGPVQSPTFVLARTHPSLVGGPPLVHVDAYRLAGADELDDLDLDFEGSVVVAEWGAGMLDEHGSWIEVVIDRPVGGAVGVALADAAEDAVEGAAARVAGATDSVPAEETNWSEAPVDPRTVTITGYGPRWAGGVLA